MIKGKYIKIGRLVHVEIQVDMDNITNFGTGQYYLTLPFKSCCEYQLRDGCLHDYSSGRQYSISGHVGENSSVLSLNYIGTNGRDEMFEHDKPITLEFKDNFHIAGTYLTY